MHQHNPQCWRVLFILLFLINRLCRGHLTDVKTCALLSTFLAFSSFLPLLSILRMVIQRTVQLFILLMGFLRQCLVSRYFLVLPKFTFLIFSFPFVLFSPLPLILLLLFPDFMWVTWNNSLMVFEINKNVLMMPDY